MALRRLTLHQLAAVPRQIAKFPDGRRRNEARAEQPMAEQVGDPFRVFDIRLTARNFPDMLRIGRHDLQSPFQKGVDRLPVHPGALHGYLGATFREQPFPQAQQLARARAQCPNLLLNLPIPQSNQQTGHHGSLMHSEPTTAFYQGLHDASIAGRLLRRRPGADTAIRPSRFRVPQTVVRGSVSYTGSVSSQSVPDLQAIAFNEGCTMDSPAPHFHVRWCAKGACGLLRKLPRVYQKFLFWNSTSCARQHHSLIPDPLSIPRLVVSCG